MPAFPLRTPLVALLVVVALGAAVPSAGATPTPGPCGGNLGVSSAQDLIDLATYCTTFEPTLTVMVNNDFVIPDGTVIPPIGSLDHPFVGLFDGNDKTITGLVVNSGVNAYRGLFGVVGATGVVKNLTLVAPRVTGVDDVGVVVGRLDEGTVQNVAITNAVVTATGSNAGGLVGRVGGGVIRQSSATGSTVSAADVAGGLVGSIEPSVSASAVVEDARSSGAVTVASHIAGGLIGRSVANKPGRTVTVERVAAAGSASAPSEAGGLIGSLNLGVQGAETHLVDVVATASATRPPSGSGDSFGGLIATVNPDSSFTGLRLVLTRVVATGAVSSSNASGGLIGQFVNGDFLLDASAGTTFWDAGSTGMANPSGFNYAAATGIAAKSTSLTTAQAKALATYTAAGNPWQMAALWQAPPAGRAWGICAGGNGGYPFPLGAFGASPCAKPAAPTSIAVTPRHDSAVVDFAPPAPGDAPITGYQYSLSAGTWDAAGSTLPFTIPWLAYGTTYSVRVRAVSSQGAGAASAPISITPSGCTGSNARVLEEAGTVADPYLIGTADDLRAVGTGDCGLSAHYRQTADIVLAAPAPNPSGLASNFSPIGQAGANRFTGTYDGGGFTITGLVWEDRSSGSSSPNGEAGLFGVLGSGAQVRRVHLRDVSLRGDTKIGGLVGLIDADSGIVEVEDVSATGQVAGAGLVGGLIGEANASAGGDLRISGAEATVDVDLLGPNSELAGGAIGALVVVRDGSAIVDDVRAAGDVSAGELGQRNVGGLLGGWLVDDNGVTPSPTDDVVLSDLVATGDALVPIGSRAGGLIGSVESAAAARTLVVDGAVARGRVTANNQAGGLIGWVELSGVDASAPAIVTSELEVVNAYATGAVGPAADTANAAFGGLIGRVGNPDPSLAVPNPPSGGLLRIGFAYARGAVYATGKGVVGDFDLSLTLSMPAFIPPYWDYETTGQTASGFSLSYGQTSTAQLTSIATYAEAAVPWAIVPLWQAPAAGRTWGICASVNDGYPFLLMEHDAMPCAAASPPTGLVGTAGDGTASIAFTAGAAGDAAITGYEVSLDDGATWSARGSGTTESPVVVAGLANGRTYRVRLRAVTGVGAGAQSVAVEVTPRAADPGPGPVEPMEVTSSKVLSGGRIQIGMAVTGPGSLSVSGVLVGGRAAKPVCASSRKVREAGTYRLTCRLDARTRTRLAKRSLRVRVTVAFRPASGAVIRDAATITMPRQR